MMSPMGTRDSLRHNVRRASAAIANTAQRLDTLNPAIVVVAGSLAVIAAAIVIGVVIYASRH